MIGRAALSDPSIFKQINDFLRTGKFFVTDKIQKINNCIDYIDNLLIYLDFYSAKNNKNKNEDRYSKFLRSSIVESRKILFTLSKKIPFANKIKEKILKILTIEDLLELKKEFHVFQTL
jgi:tRNA-dihydrouridine synthase